MTDPSRSGGGGFAFGIPLGVVLGAALVFGLFRVVEARRDRSADGAPAAPPAAASDKPAASPETDKLRAEIASLDEEGRKLAEDLKKLEDALAAKKGSVSAAGKKLAPWKDLWGDIGGKLYRMRDKIKSNESEGEPEMQELMLAFFEGMGKLSKELNVSIDELVRSPYGLPMLMLAVLDDADPPLDEAQRAKLTELIDGATAGWKDSLEKKDTSRLEMRRDHLVIEKSTFDGIKGALTPPQQAIYDQMGFLTEESGRSREWRFSGNRETLTQQLGSAWKSTLQLDDSQEAPLKPVVDEYIRVSDLLQAEFRRREDAGEKISRSEKAIAEANLMLETQKKIAETLRLSDEQKKALAEWDMLYPVSIETAPPGVPK